uniref:cDNA FLJ50697 n=1 Tax=Homo sapiens TaxID=9606 RepID=B4DUX7_HUMAN|nr:unnamed protein product [Homo sapiens]
MSIQVRFCCQMNFGSKPVEKACSFQSFLDFKTAGLALTCILHFPEVLYLPYSELIHSLPYGNLECKAWGPYRSVSWSSLLILIKGCDSWYVIHMKLLRNINFFCFKYCRTA